MDFWNMTTIIGVGAKDPQQPPNPEHIFAEIVMINRREESFHPLVYQLKKNAIALSDSLSLYRESFFKLERDSFIMVGEVETIDKKKKLIYLKNQNTIAYQHLIIINGSKHMLGHDEEEEFSGGLQALLDAIRLRKTIPSSLGKPEEHWEKDRKHKIPRATTFGPPSPSKGIEKVAQNYMLKDGKKTFSIALSGPEKHFYEVQI